MIQGVASLAKNLAGDATALINRQYMGVIGLEYGRRDKIPSP